MHTCTQTYIYTYTHIYTCTIHTYMHTHIHTHAYAHVCTDRKSQQQHLNVTSYIIDTPSPICICMHIHTYIHIHICAQPTASVFADVYVGVKAHLCNIHTCPCTSAQNTCKVHATLSAKIIHTYIYLHTYVLCTRKHMRMHDTIHTLKH